MELAVPPTVLARDHLLPRSISLPNTGPLGYRPSRRKGDRRRWAEYLNIESYCLVTNTGSVDDSSDTDLAQLRERRDGELNGEQDAPLVKGSPFGFFATRISNVRLAG